MGSSHFIVWASLFPETRKARPEQTLNGGLSFCPNWDRETLWVLVLQGLNLSDQVFLVARGV
jgi:hypothetical protein